MLNEKDDDFEYQMVVNVSATYFISKFFGCIVRNWQFEHIFNICSAVSKVAANNARSYSVTKWALLSLNNFMSIKFWPFCIVLGYDFFGERNNLSRKFVRPDDVAEMRNAVLRMSKGASVRRGDNYKAA